jgi:hypothetical protein
VRKAPALRLFLECIAQLRSEFGRRAVIVWLACCGFGDGCAVEFGELDEILVCLTVGGVL